MPKDSGSSTDTANSPAPVSLEQSFVTLRTEFDRVVEDFVREFGMPMRWRGTGHNRFGRVELEIGTGDAITPAAELMEMPEGLRLTVELPGLTEADIEVALVDNSVVISGVKDEGEFDEDMRLHFRERRFGTFRRTFRLPSHVDSDRMIAGLKNGLLTILVPRKAPADTEGSPEAVKSD